MRIARIRTNDGVDIGEYRNGVVETNKNEYRIGKECELLSPCSPSSLYCIGRNYAANNEHKDYEPPETPHFFIKPPISVLAPEAPIPYPSFSSKVTYAGELAAVIDKECKNVSENEISDVVKGYTIMNDLDALDQEGLSQRKVFDNSAPLGPWLETDVDPMGIEMETEINGEIRQKSNTNNMIFDVNHVISFLSERVTFQPGDVIAFGSPKNPGVIEPGDRIEITYQGIGTLTNSVIG